MHIAPTLDLTIVIPAYNETARLPDMFSTTLAHLESTRTSLGRTFEVLVVDDGSRDGTADLALKLGATYSGSAGDVRVVVLEKNLGKGGAVRHGMLHGRGRCLLMVDAAGASPFADLEALWTAMDSLLETDKDGAAVVVGSRAHLVKTDAVVKVRQPPRSMYRACADARTALAPPERAHVRAAHDPARRRRRAHP